MIIFHNIANIELRLRSRCIALRLDLRLNINHLMQRHLCVKVQVQDKRQDLRLVRKFMHITRTAIIDPRKR